MSVSAVPLFRQMEKIEAHLKEIEEMLLSGTEINLDQRHVPLETFSEFSKIVKKSLSENPDANV